MQSPSIGMVAQNRSTGPDSPSPDGSSKGIVAFLALLTLPFLVAAYPLVAVGLLVGIVAVVALSRSLAARVRRHRGAVRRVTLPGLGTVEYRFTRA